MGFPFGKLNFLHSSLFDLLQQAFQGSDVFNRQSLTNNEVTAQVRSII